MSLPPEISMIRFTDSYDDTFALIVQWNIAVTMTVLLILFLILLIVSRTCLRKKLNSNQLVQEHNNDKKQIQLNNIQAMINIQTQKEMNSSSEKKQITEKPHLLQTENLSKISYTILTIIYYLFWILGSLLTINLYMFNLFGRGWKKDFITFLVVTTTLVLPFTLWKFLRNKKNFKKTQLRKAYYLQMGFWILVSFIAVVVTKDVCVCQFNTKYGVNLIQDSSISTGFSRTISLGTICQSHSICHVFATLPEDGSTSVFINIQSGIGLKNITVIFRKDNEIVYLKNSTTPYRFSDVQQIGHRLVHSILFDNLHPSTTYSLQLINSEGKILHNTTYRTLPDLNATNLKMVVGGDVGLTDSSDLIANFMISYDPDVILLGGDIAYDDGMRTCYHSWDNFYDIFQNIHRKINRIIPMVLTVGNHDVGFDALGQVYVDKRPDFIPLYFLFNPQNSGMFGIGVSEIFQRDSVHYHKIGPLLIFSLDSGYIRHYDEQAQIMRNIASQYKQYYLFASFHNPIYPSCAESNEDSTDQKAIRAGIKHWVPVFDHYNFTAVLQHHTHFRKMTYQLKNGSISKGGVRYVGDGSWGVPDMVCQEKLQVKKTDIFEHFANVDPNHMWQLTLTRTNQTITPYRLNYTAVNLKGNTVFSVIDNLPNRSF